MNVFLIITERLPHVRYHFSYECILQCLHSVIICDPDMSHMIALLPGIFDEPSILNY